jgi:hypothetical protein
MKPIRDIIPGFELPEEEIITFAKDQPEYIPLPMWKGSNGERVSRWKLTWKERFTIFFGGSLWLSVLTYNRPLQPVKLDVVCPIFGYFMGDKEV